MSGDPDAWDDPVGAEIYAEVVAGGRLYPAMTRSLLALAGASRSETVLDLACGTGLAAELVLCGTRDGPRILGIDAARAMLAVGRRRVADGRAGFVEADVGRLPAGDRCCQAAICSAALWHFPNLRRALREVRRLLVPGGRFAFNVPAAQLRGVPDLPPAPLQLALARVGERRFGRGPGPAGPRLDTEDLLRWVAEAGLSTVTSRFVDHPVDQRELADLIAVPALGARTYPDQHAGDREAWIAEALGQIDPDQEIPVRWWEVLAVSAGD
jgi:SAM-dependent methyltransferase